MRSFTTMSPVWFGSMGDSDSENEGSQTNVSRLVIRYAGFWLVSTLNTLISLVIRPPGHTGKAQKGHLAFEATYESANLGRVDFVSDTEYDVYIRPDTCNPRHRSVSRIYFLFPEKKSNCRFPPPFPRRHVEMDNIYNDHWTSLTSWQTLASHLEAHQSHRHQFLPICPSLISWRIISSVTVVIFSCRQVIIALHRASRNQAVHSAME